MKRNEAGHGEEEMTGSCTSFLPAVARDVGPGAISGPCTEHQLPMALVEGGWQDAL